MSDLVNDMATDNVKNRRGLPRTGIVLILGLLLAGCASDAELDTFQPKSGVADEIYNLALPVFILAGVVLAFIAGAILFLSIKHRVPNYDDDEFPEQISHNNTLEIGWTIVPAVIMAIIAVATVAVNVSINQTEVNAVTIDVEGEPVNWEPTIVVVGQQWWWEYRYYLDGAQITTDALESYMAENDGELPPADVVTAGQFAFPAGQEVELLITSRDVIHSHWIPRLNGKRDAVPGRFSPWIVEAHEPGTYFGQCTEFCGLSHARMQMQAIAMTDADFQAWIEMQMTPVEFDEELQGYVDSYRDTGVGTALDEDASQLLRGLDVFTSQCASCHLVDGLNDLDYNGAETVSGSAPNLSHWMNNTTFAGGILDTYNEDGSINRDDLAAWIRDPNAVKDNFADNLPDGDLPRGMPNRNLSERQIDDVIAFLETLGPRPTDERIAATEVE